jgi:glycosyltransferase involved in cell wall biosynthesis
MFDREMALYRELGRLGVRVSLVTYGDRRDLPYAERLRGIRILCNWPGWPQEVYERRLVWLHAPWLWRADVVKADQTNGAEVAIWSARRWRRPVVARCGFMWIDFVEREFGAGTPQSREVERVSRMVFDRAAHIVVTTPAMAAAVQRRFGQSSDRVTVIPNYVDVDLFSPSDSGVPADGERRVLAIGRLHPEKNHMALVEALAGTGCSLTLVGSGELEDTLRRRASELGVRIEMLGNRPNRELPELIRRATVFAQPSLIEGHPKTILEAMSCGAAVLGTDVPGTRDEIKHGVNGWLCGTDPGAIKEALRCLVGDAALRRRLGVEARRHVLEHYALGNVAGMEAALYRGVVARGAK